PERLARNAATRGAAFGGGSRGPGRKYAKIGRSNPETCPGCRQTLPRAIAATNQERGIGSAGTGGRPFGQRSCLFCRSLGHFGGVDPVAKPFSTVRRMPQVPGAGRAHA